VEAAAAAAGAAAAAAQAAAEDESGAGEARTQSEGEGPEGGERLTDEQRRERRRAAAAPRTAPGRAAEPSPSSPAGERGGSLRGRWAGVGCARHAPGGA
jgi:hypothetical protein